FTTKRKIAIGLGGGAVLALATGGALGLVARSKQHQADALCPDPGTPCVGASDASALNHSAHGLAIGADVAFGAGAGLAIGAAVLWFIGQPAEHLAVVPRATAHDVGLAIEGRF